jgi:hypothetical protein
LIPGMTLGAFVIEPVACSLFSVEDRATQDKRRSDRNPRDDSAVRNAAMGRRDEGRAPPRDNPRTDTRTPGTLHNPPSIRIATLKAAGLVHYSGPGRIPTPNNILELNGSSGLTRICMMFLTRERYCRYEDTCNQKHIKRLADLTPENQTKFQDFVRDHSQLRMAPSGTNP